MAGEHLARFLWISVAMGWSLGAGEASCEERRDCDYCVGMLADSNECYWCPDQGLCASKESYTETCGRNARTTTQCSEATWSGFAVFVLFALMVSLLCFCCTACLFKRVRRATVSRARGRQDSFDDMYEADLEAPLLGEVTLVEEAEAEALTSIGAAASASIWTCPICGFDNFLEHKCCTLCGISRKAAEEHIAARTAYLSALEGRRGRTAKHIKDVMPQDSAGAQQKEMPVADGRSSAEALTQEERAISFYLRHLNSLTRRQKGASKRRLWRRVRGEDGQLYWAKASDKKRAHAVGYVAPPVPETGKAEMKANAPGEGKPEAKVAASSSEAQDKEQQEDSMSETGSEGFGLGIGLPGDDFSNSASKDGGDARAEEADAAFVSVYHESGEVRWARANPLPHEDAMESQRLRSHSSISDISTAGVMLQEAGDDEDPDSSSCDSLRFPLMSPRSSTRRSSPAPTFLERLFGGRGRASALPRNSSTREAGGAARSRTSADAPIDLANAEGRSGRLFELSMFGFCCHGRSTFPPAPRLGQQRERSMSSASSASTDDQGQTDLAAVAAMSFRRKHAWFLRQLEDIRQPWDSGHARIEISRSRLLEDSIEQLMRLSQRQLRSRLRVVFVNEPGVDAGGLVREWLTLVSERLFSTGVPQATSSWSLTSSSSSSSGQAQSYKRLFVPCGEEGGAVHIAPRDRSRVTQDLLKMYQFAGRIVGKALLEHMTISAARLSTPLLKQLLGMPVSVSDLEFVDPELYSNLTWLSRNSNAEDLHLEFSVQIRDPDDGKVFTAVLGPSPGERVPRALREASAEQKAGAKSPSGSASAASAPGVTDANKHLYVQYRLRHRLLDACGPQLWHFTKGLHSVIPPRLLCVFDHQELELLLCGIPIINVGQWKEWTDYTGEFEEEGAAHAVVRWFWDIVADMSETEKARLLQFCTGSAALPAAGFRALQSNDGRVRRFQLNGISPDVSSYPRAHTCFNRLDLPVYRDKQELVVWLSCSVNMDVTGFSMS
mmetsp:Transcript_9745/g.36623  ORF Transcript_9745/g.36623 Transcript_9745/m.36623 type:complete len:1008 (-) Transcript_9745:519-3542(-)